LETIIVVSAIACCVAILWWMYKRTEPARRGKGILVVAGWLAITAPAAFFRLDSNIAAASSSAVVGLAVFAALSRGRYDTVLDHLEGLASEEDDDDRSASLTDWLIVTSPLIILGILIFWPS
jgi:ammonia channel protein AmtB